MLYRTNVALSIKGDRIEKGQEIELSAEEAAVFDPADISPVSDEPVEEVAAPEPVPLENMTSAQLKQRAKELGLKTSGSAADLKERIALHLEGNPTEGGQPEDGEGQGEGEPTEGGQPEDGITN